MKIKEFMEKDTITKMIKKSAVFLLMFLVIIMIFTSFLWIFKVNISKWHLPVEFGITIVTFTLFYYYTELAKSGDNKSKERVKAFSIIHSISIIIGTIIFMASVFISGHIYDVTTDGNSYHKLAVGSMKNGWNPIYESSKEYTIEKGNVVTVLEDNRNYLWADHYAVGTEIIGANIYAFSNNIESGKAFSIIMMYACFGIVIDYLIRNLKLGTIKSLLTAFVLVVNPITIAQIGTYYVDTTLMMSLELIFLELISITKEKKLEKYVILAMSIAMCINAKFTGLAYSGIFCLVFYIYWLITREDKKETFIYNTIFYVITVVISVCLIGCSSYFMNFIKHGHPLYPLYGPGHVENMVNREIPESLSKKSHFEQFVISIFAKGVNVSPAYSDQVVEPELKIPLTTSKEELKNYSIPDIRMAGFGPLYSGAFIVTIIGTITLVIDFVKNKQYQSLIQYMLIFAISIILVVVLDGGYWARYIPYIYLITIINLIYLFSGKKYNKVLGYVLSAILLVNSLLIVYTCMKTYKTNYSYVKNNFVQFKQYADEKNDIIDIKLNNHAYQGVIYNIDDLGIKVNINDDLENERDVLLFKY